jgi:hypothetical protein
MIAQFINSSGVAGKAEDTDSQVTEWSTFLNRGSEWNPAIHPSLWRMKAAREKG